MTALLITVAIIVILLIIPFGATIGYTDGDLSLAVRVLIFDIGILPEKEKPPGKEKPPKEKKPKKEKPPKEGKEKKKLSFAKNELWDLAKLALDSAAHFHRKLVINNFKLYYVSADKDPYVAATSYGYANTALGALSAFADNSFNIRHKDVQTAVDFESTEPYVDFSMTATVTLAKLLGILFTAGFGFFKLRIKSQKEKALAEAGKERMDKDGTADAIADGGADAGQHE